MDMERLCIPKTWDAASQSWVEPQWESVGTTHDSIFDPPLGGEDSLVAAARRKTQDDIVISMGPNGTLVQRQGDQPRDRRQETMTGQGTVARMSEYESKMELLRSALMDFAGLQALLDRFNAQEPPVGTVIRWVKQYDARRGELVVQGASSVDQLHQALTFNIEAPQEYVFVGFRAPNGSWYTTSQRGKSQIEWDALLKEIGDSQCELVSEWVEVPAPEKPSAEAIDPLSFAKTMFGKKDAAPAE